MIDAIALCFAMFVGLAFTAVVYSLLGLGASLILSLFGVTASWQVCALTIWLVDMLVKWLRD